VCQTVINEVVRTLEPQAAARGLQLSACLPDADVLLHNDRRALGDLVRVLLECALKFTPSGEVSLELTRTAAKQGASVCIRVSGTTGAVSDEDREKFFWAFDPPGAAAKSHSGDGLQLYLARRLATFLGGDLGLSVGDVLATELRLTVPESDNGYSSGD
jgi:K+-sensing histidine kinase KdpD